MKKILLGSLGLILLVSCSTSSRPIVINPPHNITVDKNTIQLSPQVKAYTLYWKYNYETLPENCVVAFEIWSATNLNSKFNLKGATPYTNYVVYITNRAEYFRIRACDINSTNVSPWGTTY